MDNELNFLSRKAGFNTALRHFRQVTSYVKDIQYGKNLADLLNLSLDEGEIQRDQIKPVISSLAVDKFEYSYKSCNLLKTIEDPDKIINILASWGKIQLVMTYFSPQTGLFVVNPKAEPQWEQALPLMKDELVVIYAGPVGEETLSRTVLDAAVGDFIKLLGGASVKTRKEFISQERPAQERPKPAAQPQAAATAQGQVPAAAGAAPAAAVSGGKKRMTPRYGVLVTNELFHNGNVESWKRVIESYKAKYPGLDVLIWYENERINDINTLFKWGKVKHGTPIMISVVGDDIKDVSKLQKYLFEGASPRFEVFLRGAVNRTLDLF
ncbi:MAG: hypothetical protein LBK13_13205 [Spirochaetales bacterium]|jgi:hypothetical protein|nr:hypothetical protein [Spirochaetales bacterium]